MTIFNKLKLILVQKSIRYYNGGRSYRHRGSLGKWVNIMIEKRRKR